MYFACRVYCIESVIIVYSFQLGAPRNIFCKPSSRQIWGHLTHDCLLSRSFRRRSKKTSKLCVTGLCEGNSTVTGEFPSQRASNAENASIWVRHNKISFGSHRYNIWQRVGSCRGCYGRKKFHWIREQDAYSTLATGSLVLKHHINSIHSTTLTKY